MHSNQPGIFQSEWRAAVSGFVFAGLVGAWMRYAMSTGNWAGLEFMHVRHAHSHVMLFVWATSAWMIILARHMIQRGAAGAGFRRVIHASLGLGMLSFLPFLFWGYKFAEIGGLRLPISIVVSTAVMFVWYAFAWLWWRHRGVIWESSLRTLLDVSVASMVLCTIGAWLRGMLMPFGVDDMFWTTGVVHMFLNTLTDGWLLVGLLALLALRFGENLRVPRWSLFGIILALPFSFLVNVGAAEPGLRTLGALASGIFVLAIGRAWVPIFRRQFVFLNVALGLVFLARLLYGIPEIMAFADRASLRVPYLHWVFLSVVSVALWEAWGDRWMARATAWTSVPLVLGILPATALWPIFANSLGLEHSSFIKVGHVFTILTSLGPSLVALGWLLMTRAQKGKEEPCR